VAGSRGNLQIWDTSTNKAVREAFATRVAPEKMGTMEEDVQEKLVGLALSDDEESDEEEEMEQREDGGVEVDGDDDEEDEE